MSRGAEVEARKIHQELLLEHVLVVPSEIRSGGEMRVEIAFRALARGRVRECAVLIYSDKGVHVAIVDARESGKLPFNYEQGGFILVSRIEALPLVQGDFTIGLYLATEGFRGDIYDLADFAVEKFCGDAFVPYSPEVRGFLDLRVSTCEIVAHAMVTAP
jgi:lipopolysaccharide transport system ATP-binding protein